MVDCKWLEFRRINRASKLLWSSIFPVLATLRLLPIVHTVHPNPNQSGSLIPQSEISLSLAKTVQFHCQMPSHAQSPLLPSLFCDPYIGHLLFWLQQLRVASVVAWWSILRVWRMTGFSDYPSILFSAPRRFILGDGENDSSSTGRVQRVECLCFWERWAFGRCLHR